MPRKPIKTDGLELIAEIVDLRLYLRGHKDGWWNLKLVRTGKGTMKRQLSLSWNGERFAEGYELKLLRQHEPKLHDWVLATCQEKFMHEEISS